MPEKEILSPMDLERAGIAKQQTLAKWRLFGKGPRWLKLNGSVRYRKSDVEAWLAECSRGGQHPAGGAAA